jgi:twitching motility protein PilT
MGRRTEQTEARGREATMARIDELLRILLQRHGSDLHLRSSLAPFMREHGAMVPLPGQPTLSGEQCRELIAEIMPERNRIVFETDWDTDFAYESEGLGRFRVNALQDRHGIGAVLRTIPTTPLTADQLNLPAVVRDFCYLKKGLVLVTGPTGSGKSTTLAAMIDLINKTRSEHIITIEDPLEFIHATQKCVVTQREVHAHTRSFASALRAALREDPNIVMVGEMRDLETTETAIETAETGHLVFGTLHTNTAASTVERIIDKFPASRQNQIRSMLANSLKGVIAQTLCQRIGGKGRVAAMEILVVTTGIASNIREGKTHQIPSAMQVGRTQGMQLFDDALLDLLKAGTISLDEAYSRAINKDSLAKSVAALGVRFDVKAEAAADGGESLERRQGILNMYLDALQKEPDNPDILNNLAWLLATADNPDAGTLERALAMAEKANVLTAGLRAGVLDTLGAAYAQSGRFDMALDAARKGLKLARLNKEMELAAALERRIELYERGVPIRE